MSILENVYNRFMQMEDDYICNHNDLTKEEYVRYLFGGSIDEGAAIITEAIMMEEPNTTEEIEMFSTLKDMFNFFIKYEGSIDSTIRSFDMLLSIIGSENEAFGKYEELLTMLYTIQPYSQGIRPYTQESLYATRNALHYKVTPEVADYAPLDTCNIYKVMTDAYAELYQRIMEVEKKFELGKLYVKTKTDAVKISIKNIPDFLLK